MAFINEYPYSDFNEYNMDWIIKTVKDLSVAWAETKTEWGDMQTEWTNYKNYIDNYFDNLDLSQEVSDKIDEMAADGFFTDLFNTLFRSDVIAEAASVTSDWIDTNLLQETGYVIDTSLSVSSAAADAKVTGDYLRALDPSMPEITWTIGKAPSSNGTIQTNTYMAMSDPIRVSPGDALTRTMQAKDSNNVTLIMYYTYYDQSEAFIRRDAVDEGDTSIAPNDVYYVLISFGRASSSGVTFVSGDLSYFDTEIIFESLDRPKASDKVHIYYTANASGDDMSVEQFYITIHPALDKTFSFSMGRSQDNSIQADIWRIMYLYTGYPKFKGGATRLSTHAEWECALHLDGASDFSGGQIHGSEILDDITVITDGVPVADITQLAGDFNEIRIIRTSTLYHPDDTSDAIAKHGCEYIFTNDGMIISQSVKWIGARTLTNCFLGMYPPRKTVSPYRYDNTDIDVISNPASNYSDTLEKALKVTEFSSTLTGSIEQLTMYPDDMTGRAMLVADNQGLDYNKVYVRVCNAGSVANDDIWYNSVKYQII